jgi:hypothetical protein
VARSEQRPRRPRKIDLQRVPSYFRPSVDARRAVHRQIGFPCIIPHSFCYSSLSGIASGGGLQILLVSYPILAASILANHFPSAKKMIPQNITSILEDLTGEPAQREQEKRTYNFSAIIFRDHNATRPIRSNKALQPTLTRFAARVARTPVLQQFATSNS